MTLLRLRYALCIVVTLALGGGVSATLAAQTPAPVRNIDSLLARMTLEEKLGQLNQLSVDNQPTPEQLELVRKGLVGSFLNLTGAAATRDAQHIAVTESRLRIPLIFGHDVIHGYRTIFPIPLGEAASWDPEAVEAAARVAAREAAAAGLHWTFAPMVDIARDPRWGRIAEGSGEDPYLGSAMAAARVRGFQGADPRAPDAVLATVKHFAAYGGAEGGRDYNTVDLSERTLREVYLPPYRAALDAGAATRQPSGYSTIPTTARHRSASERPCSPPSTASSPVAWPKSRSSWSRMTRSSCRSRRECTPSPSSARSPMTRSRRSAPGRGVATHGTP